MTHTPEYRTWKGMRQRCRDKGDTAYARYGGRGIRVCDRWEGEQGFLNFCADMGPRPEGTTLDRLNVDDHYYKENCRWATQLEQANNRRTNRVITMAGVKKTLAQLVRETGKPRTTLRRHLMRGTES